MRNVSTTTTPTNCYRARDEPCLLHVLASVSDAPSDSSSSPPRHPSVPKCVCVRRRVKPSLVDASQHAHAGVVSLHTAAENNEITSHLLFANGRLAHRSSRRQSPDSNSLHYAHPSPHANARRGTPSPTNQQGTVGLQRPAVLPTLADYDKKPLPVFAATNRLHDIKSHHRDIVHSATSRRRRKTRQLRVLTHLRTRARRPTHLVPGRPGIAASRPTTMAANTPTTTTDRRRYRSSRSSQRTIPVSNHGRCNSRQRTNSDFRAPTPPATPHTTTAAHDTNISTVRLQPQINTKQPPPPPRRSPRLRQKLFTSMHTMHPRPPTAHFYRKSNTIPYSWHPLSNGKLFDRQDVRAGIARDPGSSSLLLNYAIFTAKMTD